MKVRRCRSGFTLIELLVVIAIIAILAVVVVLTLNPAELLHQSRDANRVSDMATITDALNVYVTDQTGASSFSLGNASDTYPSTYDPSATSTAGDQCQGLGLFSLNTSTGQVWQCAPSSTLRNVNDTGWVPVNLNKISAGSPIGSLPVDPTNQTSTGLFYSYNTNGTQFEVTADLESQKYKSQFGQNPNTNLFPEVISGGTPTISALYNPSGLMGYWPMTEGSGTTFLDHSGNGENGVFYGGGITWSGGKVGSAAINIASSTSAIGYTIPVATNLPSTAITISMWINANSFGNWSAYLGNSWAATNGTWQLYSATGGSTYFAILSGGTQYGSVCNTATTTATAGQWQFLAGTYDGNTIKSYLNGSLCPTTQSLSSQLLYQTSTGLLSSVAAGTAYSIDDVRLYNRALSAAEIQALYTAEK